MKKIIVYTLLLMLAAALPSCYWISGYSVADLTLNLSTPSAKGPDDRYARVWLIADNKIYPLREASKFVEIPLAANSNPEIQLTLEDIPVGPAYRVWLALGREQSGGWFLTDGWAESQSFKLAAGENTRVPFTEEDLFAITPFQPVWELMGKSLKGVVVDQFDTIVTAEWEAVYSASGGPSSFASTTVPGGHAINSLDAGIDVDSPDQVLAWLNTNRGIVPFNDLTFDTDFSSSLGSVSVLGSAARETSGGSTAWFFRDGGLGGAYIDLDIAWNPASWNWANLESERVYDCITDFPGNGFFATSGGAFKLPREFLLDSSPSIDENKVQLDTPAKVFSWGLVDQFGDGDTLLMGTADGAWSVQMNDGVFQGAAVREPNTAGHAIRLIAVADYPPVFKAYLSDSDLFIWNGAAGSWSRFPLCAGLPGKITGMAWLRIVTVPVIDYLIVSGEEGLVYLVL